MFTIAPRRRKRRMVKIQRFITSLPLHDSTGIPGSQTQDPRQIIPLV